MVRYRSREAWLGILLAALSGLGAERAQALDCGTLWNFLQGRATALTGPARYQEIWAKLETHFATHPKVLNRDKLNFLQTELQRQKRWNEWELAAYLDYLFFKSEGTFRKKIEALNPEPGFVWKTTAPQTKSDLEEDITDLLQSLYKVQAVQKFQALRKWPLRVRWPAPDHSIFSEGSWPWGRKSLANQWLAEIKPLHKTSLKQLKRMNISSDKLPPEDEISSMSALLFKGFPLLYQAPHPIKHHTLSQSLQDNAHYRRSLGFHWIASKGVYVMITGGAVSGLIELTQVDWEELWEEIKQGKETLGKLKELSTKLLHNQDEIFKESDRLRRAEISKIEDEIKAAKAAGREGEVRRLEHYLRLQKRRIEAYSSDAPTDNHSND